MLKMTGLKLEQISDIDMYLLIEKRLRRGMSYICKIFSEKLSKYIMYFEADNLCGWTMSRYLPYGRFEWLKNVDKFDVNSISENSLVGYIFEVDFKYPDELHYLHNDYPLAPEKFAIPYNMLSNYCKNIVEECGIKVGDVKKLIPNLGSKTNYVVHYKNLQLYSSLEMKLTKIHRVLKFEQSDWMKKHIDFNTEKKENAANSFQKDFF